MNTATMRAILRTRLHQVDDLPPVKYEARKYERPFTTTHIEDEFRGGTATGQSNGTTEARPLYLLTLKVAPTAITDDMDRITDAVLHAFEPGRTLIDTDRTHQLEVVTCDAGAYRVMPDAWGYRRITIGLSAIAFRSPFQPA
jgi:hypothetical protein